MQLLCDFSEEGETKGLGVFPLNVKTFRRSRDPHIGWNKISALEGPLFKQVNDGSYAYYVHGYYVPVSEFTIARSIMEKFFRVL